MIFGGAFLSEKRARDFAVMRLRDVPAIEAIEIWQGETKLIRVDRSGSGGGDA